MNQELTMPQEKKRPVFLTVLCVIAFLHVGMSIIMGLVGTIMSPELGWFRPTGIFSLFTDGMNHLLGLRWSVVMLVLAIVAFVGIVQIWKMKRLGVWLFSIPLFLTILLPIVLMGPGWWILIPNIIMIFFLIFLFALNYERLR
ncbi:MAG: hypothetical protein ACOCX0_03680 [Bacteroidota bacterium]